MIAPADKRALRSAMRDLRPSLARACPDAATRAAARYVQANAAPARVAAVYRPIGAELDPQPLAAILRAAGAVLALPVTLAAEVPLAFRLWAEGALLVTDAAGVAAPDVAAMELTPDLVIAPLLAFDRTGARLGQGGGHYDRTLAALRARGRVFALGLAYAGQEVDALPVEAHDQRLDAVLTEAGLIRFDL